MKTTIIEKPSPRMLTVVICEALSISQMVREAREAGLPGPSIAMHIELDTKLKPGGQMAIFTNGTRIAPCPFEIFRTMPVSDHPIMHRLLALEGQRPNDLVIAVTEGNTVFQGFAMRDFRLDQLTVMGAL